MEFWGGQTSFNLLENKIYYNISEYWTLLDTLPGKHNIERWWTVWVSDKHWTKDERSVFPESHWQVTSTRQAIILSVVVGGSLLSRFNLRDKNICSSILHWPSIIYKASRGPKISVETEEKTFLSRSVYKIILHY